MTIVSNSGPILSFARARRFDLLREVVGTLTVPEAVYADIVVRGAGKLGAEDVQHAAWITRTSVRDRTFVDQLPQRLHLGECEALALARELDAVLLIDEREARRAAQQYGIAHFGSLRVLEEAKERGLILANLRCCQHGHGQRCVSASVQHVCPRPVGSSPPVLASPLVS